MPILLSNGVLTATIEPKGAELQSLVSHQTGLEYLWKGDPAFWGKHSPVLFPIVGALKNNRYLHANRAFEMSRHGFARDKTFEAEQISETEAIFTLVQDEETLAMYPFPFVLRLRYVLNHDKLGCSYEVFNPAKSPLLFSIGAHPAFAVPLVEGDVYENYSLQFNREEPLLRWKLDNGLISDGTALVPTQHGRLPLDRVLLNDDAIVLKNLESDRITLSSTAHGHGLHFGFSGFPFFGIWTAKNAPFLCLEPWAGIADSVHHNQRLEEKEGIISLPPGGLWQNGWTVTCF